jgi:uncharacterized membrane protein/protein-disulfide isomerase
MKQQTRIWLFIFVLLGLGASLTSFYVQYRMLGDPTYSSFCNFSQALNCETAYRSRFGTFQGVPVALGGVIWFTLALLLTIAVHPKGGAAESGAAAYLFLMSIPAVSVVLFLAYASILILNAVCILCVVTYLAVLGVFLISGATADAPLAGLPQQAVRDARALAARPFALGVAIVFLAGAASAVAFFPRAVVDPRAALAAALAHQPTEFDLWFESQIRVPIDVPTDGAQVLIVKFNDYQCPASAETYQTHGPVLATYQTARPGKVKVILKDYPLEPECNPNVATTVHDAACEGAVAVRLAERQRRGAAMEEWLYTHKAGLTRAAVRQAAKEIGGVSDFDTEYPRVLALVQKDVDLGHRLGVKGTPTFFINGVRIDGTLEPQVLDQAIAHELRVSAANP